MQSDQVFCTMCGAAVKQYPEGYRDSCWECGTGDSEEAEDDGLDGGDRQDLRYMRGCGLRPEYWL